MIFYVFQKSLQFPSNKIIKATTFTNSPNTMQIKHMHRTTRQTKAINLNPIKQLTLRIQKRLTAIPTINETIHHKTKVIEVKIKPKK